MNGVVTLFTGCVILSLLSPCSLAQTNSGVHADSDNQRDAAVKKDSSGSPDKNKEGNLFSLAAQMKLTEEAIELSRLQLRLDRIAQDYASSGKPIPRKVVEARNAAADRQTAIAEQLFLMSGRLQLDARNPGIFGGYVAECVDRINQAFQKEDSETRRRFAGKSAVVTVQLAASGQIQSVVAYSPHKDNGVGSFLHSVIWKVPSFPEIPQLKERAIERVHISIPLNLLTNPNQEAAVLEQREDAISARQREASRLEGVRVQLQQTEIEQQIKEYSSRRPRKKFLGSRVEELALASYLETWRQKTLSVAAENYPAEARGKLYGSVVVFVELNVADGSLHNAEVLRSSGHKILDEAALGSIRKAAPYGSIPREGMGDAVILSFARTLQFARGDE